MHTKINFLKNFNDLLSYREKTTTYKTDNCYISALYPQKLTSERVIIAFQSLRKGSEN